MQILDAAAGSLGVWFVGAEVLEQGCEAAEVEVLDCGVEVEGQVFFFLARLRLSSASRRIWRSAWKMGRTALSRSRVSGSM